MKTASAFSIRDDSRSAALEALSSLLSKLVSDPQLLVVYATEALADDGLIKALREQLPRTQIIGGTSCGGVMTEAGFHTGQTVLGLFGIVDPDGAYGVGAAPIGTEPARASALALEQALEAAGRKFETPALIWCCQPPGAEEAVIEGIQSVIGPHTPVMGGSAADEAIAGNWREFCGAGVVTDHVIVAALFPTARYGAAFQSGYAPTELSGVVTRAEGRRLLEIDDQPAAQVYDRWTEGRLAIAGPANILAASTPTPLGRIAGEIQGVPMYVLSHVGRIGETQDLLLFTNVDEGDEVRLMRGSACSLVKRAGLVVTDACTTGGWQADATLGGLVVYCGGCMLHVRSQMDDAVGEIRHAMPGAPFLGAFTFGEQGAMVDARNRHGNLMVSALTFG